MRYAGFWRRLFAHIIDSVILNLGAWVGSFLIFGGMYLVYYVLAQRGGAELKPFADAFDPFMTQVVNAVIYLGLAAPYFIWGTYRYGTTVGKKWLGVYVVSAKDGAPVTLGQSTTRFFSYALSYATMGGGFLMAAFHPQKRALHDLIAGTVSIRKNE